MLSLKGGNRPDLLELNRLNFKEFKPGKYLFNPARNLTDFNGYVLDGSAVVRNLSIGEILLQPGPDTVTVSFDLSFADAIHVTGFGEVPVRKVSAP